MSGRCKACDKKFSDSEMLAKNPTTKEPEDLCSKCRAVIGIGKDDGKEKAEVVEDLRAYSRLLETLSDTYVDSLY